MIRDADARRPTSTGASPWGGVLILVLTSCDSMGSGGQSSIAATRSGLAAAGIIGSACTASDGWQRDPSMSQGDSGASAMVQQPVVVSLRGLAIGQVDRHNVAPGIKYCIPKSPAYPDGYLTANCRTDSDCSEGYCSDGQCRMACIADRDCRAPSRCVGGSHKFCRNPSQRQSDPDW
jgi:hypothetical protein